MANRTAKAQQAIREITCDMDTAEYIDFMRELAEWAGHEADLCDFTELYLSDEDMNGI